MRCQAQQNRHPIVALPSSNPTYIHPTWVQLSSLKGVVMPSCHLWLVRSFPSLPLHYLGERLLLSIPKRQQEDNGRKVQIISVRTRLSGRGSLYISSFLFSDTFFSPANPALNSSKGLNAEPPPVAYGDHLHRPMPHFSFLENIWNSEEFAS